MHDARHLFTPQVSVRTMHHLEVCDGGLLLATAWNELHIDSLVAVICCFKGELAMGCTGCMWRRCVVDMWRSMWAFADGLKMVSPTARLFGVGPVIVRSVVFSMFPLGSIRKPRLVGKSICVNPFARPGLPV